MGNRACVVFVDNKIISPVVYLHWNGGPDSIYAFLEELKRRKVRDTADYACARFIHIVGDFFDSDGAAGSLSLGVWSGPQAITSQDLKPFANSGDDNGVYVINMTDYSVRRFVGDNAREMTPKEVSVEAKKAKKSLKDFANVFVTIRPKISEVEGYQGEDLRENH